MHADKRKFVIRVHSRLFAAIFFVVAAHAATIRLENGVFRVDGWKPVGDLASAFAIYVGNTDTPMLGSYADENGVLVFHPRFPLSSGMSYRAVFHPPGEPSVTTIFDGPPRKAAASTAIVEIYPSAHVLPANTLKLYIVFSAPMSRGEASRRIKLLDRDAKPVELPFLDIQQELWSPDYQRLTVLFNPGRIKRGLVPNQEDGPPLKEGGHYALVVDAEWPDAQGQPLRAEHVKGFEVGPADRTPPEPKQWKIATPKAGTRDALVVDFGKPMDYALLHRVVNVPGVPGKIAIAEHEREWRFTPDQPWRAGEHKIEIDTALEDISGNGVGRPFDIDVFERVTKTIERKTVSLPFRVR
jgi:hypothetical protein